MTKAEKSKEWSVEFDMALVRLGCIQGPGTDRQRQKAAMEADEHVARIEQQEWSDRQAAKEKGGRCDRALTKARELGLLDAEGKP